MRSADLTTDNTVNSSTTADKVDVDAISLKVKHEFAAKEKAKAAKPATPKPPAKAAKNSKAA